MTSVSVEWFEEDVEVHFVYRARRVEKGRGVPLLFLHGWPGSFIKGNKKKSIPHPRRRKSAHIRCRGTFTPHFWFFGGISKKGFGLSQYAEFMPALMTRLRYTE
ncbi:hypothetical protein TMatcc_001635 [Talaromyces marneffei ATCC 18224]